MSGGLCVILGLTEAGRPLAVARQGPFTVHGLAADPRRVEPAREAIRAAGVYGKVSIQLWSGPRLPYSDNRVTLVVAEDWPALAAGGLRASEVFRVLAPLGAARLEATRPGDAPPGWKDSLAAELRAAGAVEVTPLENGVQVRKAWPDAIDEWSHYLLFARPAEGKTKTWMKRIPVRVRAMLAAGDRLLAAGPPDAVDPKDPWGAFENRRGGVLLALDAATGERRAERILPSPPVFNGMAAAGGRLFLSEEGGGLACFGR